MRTRIPPAFIASAQAGAGGVTDVRASRRAPSSGRVTGTAALIEAGTANLLTSAGGCLSAPFATFDVTDAIARAAHGTDQGVAVERCSASVERPDTRKELG